MPPANDNSDKQCNEVANSSLGMRVAHPQDGSRNDEYQHSRYETDYHPPEGLKSFGTLEDKIYRRDD